MKPSIICTPLVLALGAAATDYTGTFSSIPDGGSDELKLAAANRHPNSTSSTTFERPGGTWTWRVNISDISVPDAEGQYAQPDPHVVNVVWDLHWPGGDSFTDAVQHELNSTSSDCSGDCSAGRFCFTNVNLMLSAKSASKYDPSDNGDCSGVLGSKCAKSLMDSYAGPSPGPSPEGCITFPLGELDGCGFSQKDSDDFGFVAFTFGLGNSSVPRKNAQNQTWHQGDVMASHRYDVMNSSDTKTYDEATQSLQMLILQGAGNISIVCQVVDAAGSALAPAWCGSPPSPSSAA